MQPAEVATAFVARINDHDLVGLKELMTDDHMFIDGLDNRVGGRAAVVSGWAQYFTLIPDYWIRIDRTLQNDWVVGLFGTAGGTYASARSGEQKGRWEVPAAWLAETRDGRVSMWRVYADNLPIRRLMGVERV